jgi:cytochrome P450
MSDTLMSPEATTTPQRGVDPAAVVLAIQVFCRGIGVPVDDDPASNAYIAAAILLLTLGVEVDVDPADGSATAREVREIILEEKTRTTTRSRRAL